MITQLDHKLSLALSGWARKHRAVGFVSVLLASWLIWFIGFAALGVAFTSFEHLKYFVGVLIIGWAFNLLLGKIKERARPYETHKYEALISTWWLGGSFPSDHAMMATVCSSLIFVLGGPWVWVAIAAVVLVTLGRVLVGVHYVSDVVVGTIVGLLAMLVMLQLTPILG